MCLCKAAATRKRQVMTDVIVSRFVRYRLQWLCSFRYARMPVTCKLGTDYRTYVHHVVSMSYMYN